MKQFLILILLMFVSTSLCARFSESEQKAIIRIDAHDPSRNKTVNGTAFFVSQQYVLTVAHVVYRMESHEQLEAKSWSFTVGGKRYPLQLISHDVSTDLALFHSPSYKSSSSITVEQSTLDNKDEVIAYGNFVGGTGSGRLKKSKGYVLAPYESAYNGCASTPVYPGFSGGPCAHNGKLCGVMSKYGRNDYCLFYVRPDTITNFLRTIGFGRLVKN